MCLAEKCLPRIGMKDLMMKKVHDERANSSRSLSRRKFLKVSATSAAIVGAGALSGCMYGSSMGAPGTTPRHKRITKNRQITAGAVLDALTF